MTPSPIPRVLSTLRRHRVRALLMGGQACILYGAAEFSRDVDVAVAVDPANIARLRKALKALHVERIYFPALSIDVLRRGHACHFRCRAAGNVRLDVMSVMRGADSFERLWTRRVRMRLAGVVEVVSIPDLVRIKKTQRDKDWAMIARLVESDIVSSKPTPSRVRFWLRECRTAERLEDLAARFPKAARRERRRALKLAMAGRRAGAERALQREIEAERRLDRRYWAPLRAELERMRLSR